MLGEVALPQAYQQLPQTTLPVARTATSGRATTGGSEAGERSGKADQRHAHDHAQTAKRTDRAGQQAGRLWKPTGQCRPAIFTDRPAWYGQPGRPHPYPYSNEHSNNKKVGDE